MGTTAREPSAKRSLPSRWTRPASLMLTAGLIGALASGCSSNGSSGTPAAQANALVQSGLRAQSHGQTQQALNDYLQATAKDPTNKFAYYDAGVIYQQQNNLAAAEAAYHKALLVDPNYKPALFNLAICLTPSDPAQAIATYRQLLQINQNDPNVLFNLGLLLIAQNQGAEGHADLQKAIQLQPALRSRVPAGITP